MSRWTDGSISREAFDARDVSFVAFALTWPVVIECVDAIAGQQILVLLTRHRLTTAVQTNLASRRHTQLVDVVCVQHEASVLCQVTSHLVVL